MTNELKVKLLDEIVGNMDNDDRISLNNGSISYHGGEWYTDTTEDEEVSFDTFEEAVKSLGYD